MTDLNTSGFHIRQLDVTAGVARAMLDTNSGNQRNLRTSKVEQYARDMLSGHWPITGETIKLDTTGTLIDGQHRLSAVLLASASQPGISVPMLVAYNVTPDAMPVLDTGLSRGLHDLIGITKGVRAAHLVAAVVRRVLQWEDGNRMGVSGRSGGIPTHTEAMLRLEKDVEGFVAAAARGRDAQTAGLAPGAPSGTAFYLFRQLDADAAHRFFDFLIGGANLDGPILTLRNRLIRKERLRSHEYLSLYARTWNAWRDGRELAQVLVSTRERLSNSNFPIPR